MHLLSSECPTTKKRPSHTLVSGSTGRSLSRTARITSVMSRNCSRSCSVSFGGGVRLSHGAVSRTGVPPTQRARRVVRAASGHGKFCGDVCAIGKIKFIVFYMFCGAASCQSRTHSIGQSSLEFLVIDHDRAVRAPVPTTFPKLLVSPPDPCTCWSLAGHTGHTYVTTCADTVSARTTMPRS